VLICTICYLSVSSNMTVLRLLFSTQRFLIQTVSPCFSPHGFIVNFKLYHEKGLFAGRGFLKKYILHAGLFEKMYCFAWCNSLELCKRYLFIKSANSKEFSNMHVSISSRRSNPSMSKKERKKERKCICPDANLQIGWTTCWREWVWSY